jgi:nucleolar protein 58
LKAANKLVKLAGFHKFDDTTEALAAITAAVEGKLSKVLIASYLFILFKSINLNLSLWVKFPSYSLENRR